MNHMTRLLFYNRSISIKKGFYEKQQQHVDCKKAEQPASSIHCVLSWFTLQGRRHLLSASSLGLDRFIETKKFILESTKDKEKFIKEMEEASNSDNDTLIFTNDIKKIVMLVSEDNLEIIPKMLKKLSLQNKTIKFQRYVFGPDIMKLYYLHNKPIEALALVEDKDTVQHFIQITSFSVLSDLLFNNGMYQDVLCMYQYFHSKANVHRNAVQALIVLYFAACYKLNSLTSLEEAIALWKKLDRKGVRLHKRALAYLGLLALNQNKPQITIEIMYHSRLDPVLLNVKVRGLAKSKRFDDVFHTLKDALAMDDTLFIMTDTVSYIKNELAIDKVEYIPKFHQLIDELKGSKQLSHKSLDDVLSEDIDVNITYRANREQKQ